eukprot:gene14343-15839_t
MDLLRRLSVINAGTRSIRKIKGRHLQILHRHLSAGGVARPPRVCIIGSGPAGFYTAQQLLKTNASVIVDIYERLPVPFGLVRFGVAPDHPEVKNVVNTFHTVAQNERCNFFGNVNIGQDVKTKELRNIYDAVVLAYGADKDKTLGIKGEDLEGVISARSFVGWYNGMPAQQDLCLNLSGETAVVVGHGNVALDVARILLSPYDIIKYTDICEYALDVLKTSKIKNVIVAGRRGPLEASFTIKELREMINLPNCRAQFRQEDFVHIKPMLDSLPRQKKRIAELMCKTAFAEEEEMSLKENMFSTMFLRSPVEILSDGVSSRVAGVRFEVNKLVSGEDGFKRPVGTGVFEDVRCNLVLRSIGYKSIQVDEGIPFDTRMGIIPNKDGRVTESADSDSMVKGLYCSGWVKHGPVGVILTTMTEAKSTANAISQDLKNSNGEFKSATIDDVKVFLASKNVTPISFIDWEKIDAEETRRGKEHQKPREKIVSKKEMLKFALKENDS